ncbi:hypothetical protein NSK_004303 [Nannochloropsis salina CCMP1776]|uniref:ATP-dependent DNA helicase n=1 Tax=Nannochloropsis salina CCMP1776 TaxID=1027361 RepID=A0A4D9CY84_9STRA|nr:hypothetical protein NSK_004303 [Nannochloropsis salina CCMP1776]|eukprot:TFJ84312.1 hypothetical protein NSK_004303 [Nannochloropsis salina CCMP1776]
MEGHNVYYSGRAGSGKTHLLRAIIDRAPAGKTFVTASTGIAAVNVGGTTLHSFAGIGLGDDPLEVLKERAGKNRTAAANWAAVEVLIVDEVSMLHGSLLSKLNEIAKHVKNQPHRPFGGVQLIFTGDFFQLPPVSRGRRAGDHDYAFLHPVWKELFGPESCYELTRVFRQAEKPLVALLNDVRYGRASAESIALLQELSRDLKPPPGIEPTLLFATNNRVDEMNQQKLGLLAGAEEHVFQATDSGVEPFLGQLRKNCLAESRLRLRIGAQVMLLKNVNANLGLVNGAKGRVTSFTNDEEHLPIVEFASGMQYSIAQEEWAIEVSERGRTVKKAVRLQVPLKLGWAITIHKSQGMGLEWLECKLDDVFEDGQAYVALSRAVKLEGLRVLTFRQDRFRVSLHVVSFYDSQIKGKTRREPGEESSWLSSLAPNWLPEHPNGSTLPERKQTVPPYRPFSAPFAPSAGPYRSQKYQHQQHEQRRQQLLPGGQHLPRSTFRTASNGARLVSSVNNDKNAENGSDIQDACGSKGNSTKTNMATSKTGAIYVNNRGSAWGSYEQRRNVPAYTSRPSGQGSVRNYFSTKK